MISYDPDEKPHFEAEELMKARELGLHPLQVICDEQGARVGDAGGVSFPVFAHFIPRVGDRIKLEDGKRCEVVRVYFSVSRNPQDKTPMLVPNVYAIRLTKDEDE